MVSVLTPRPSILGPNGRPLASYDALDTRGRRHMPATRIHSEDAILGTKDRRKLTSQVRDLRRNYELVAWAIRCHLDYVSSFKWQATTEDQGLNDRLEAWMAEVTTAGNFDAAGRHNLSRFVRLMEAARTDQGDVWALKQNDGTIQAIEGDRVALPTAGKVPSGFSRDRFTNGVITDRRGKVSQVAVCDREAGQLSRCRVLNGRFFWQLGYFDRFDQVRGVSPLSSAINRFRDTYEGMELALAKSKVEQLFALVITRNGDEAIGDVSATTDEFGNPVESSYQVDFGRGPQTLDLDPGDDAKFLKSESPGGQFESFEKLSIMLALKSLDIPFSFFDESHTNFYGSRGGLQQYVKSAEAKRADVARFLRSWTMWRMAVDIRDRRLDIGTRELADAAGEWRAVGIPWWDPSKEIDGHLKAIAAGLDNPQRIAKSTTGTDYFENLELRAQAEQRARDLGVELSWTASNQQQLTSGEESDDE